MQASSELHIIVPGICGPLAETRPLENSDAVNKWIKTLAKSDSGTSQKNTIDVITSIFNLNVEHDFPSAALTLLADEKYDKTKHYMHADPVHLQADMDHAILTSSNDLNISDSESASLRDSLNQHFKQDGLEFIALNKNQWFVSTEHEIHMATTPLAEAVGRNINFILPEGKQSTRWKQLLTEAQMLMHSHPVNETRESAGQLSINSLWFHGSGRLNDELSSQSSLPKNVTAKVSRVCSNEKMLKGLASYLNCDYMTVPASVDEYAESLLANNNNSVNVLHLPELEHLVNYTDVTMWSENLSELVENWVYPLLNVAYKNNIKITLYPCNKLQYQFSKYHYLRFWRDAWGKVKLEKYVNSY